MGENHLPDLNSVEARISYLERVIYDYKSGGWMDAEANPAVATTRVLQQQEAQAELDELRFLRRMYDESVNARIIVRGWQVIVVILMLFASLAFSALALVSTVRF